MARNTRARAAPGVGAGPQCPARVPSRVLRLPQQLLGVAVPCPLSLPQPRAGAALALARFRCRGQPAGEQGTGGFSENSQAGKVMLLEGNKPCHELTGEWCQGKTKLLSVLFSNLASSVTFLTHGNVTQK